MTKIVCENRRNCKECISRGIKEEDCCGEFKCDKYYPIKVTPIEDYLKALKGGAK